MTRKASSCSGCPSAEDASTSPDTTPPRCSRGSRSSRPRSPRTSGPRSAATTVSSPPGVSTCSRPRAWIPKRPSRPWCGPWRPRWWASSPSTSRRCASHRMITAARFAEGMTVAEYLDQMRVNKERFVRVMREAAIEDEDREALRRLGPGLRILIVTEDWCGDALYSFPALARLVEGEPGVEVRVFLRDKSPDVMDQYLKRGPYRTTPVSVFFDERMNELARFVERQDVVSELHTLSKV